MKTYWKNTVEMRKLFSQGHKSQKPLKLLKMENCKGHHKPDQNTRVLETAFAIFTVDTGEHLQHTQELQTHTGRLKSAFKNKKSEQTIPQEVTCPGSLSSLWAEQRPSPDLKTWVYRWGMWFYYIFINWSNCTFYSFFIFFFMFLFQLGLLACGQFPDQGWNPQYPQWKHRVLTMGLPGKS